MEEDCGEVKGKKDFQEYVDRLPDEYKTQVKRQNTNGEKDNVDGPEKDKSLKEQDKSAKNKGEDGSNRTDDNIGIGKPKKIPHRHAKTKEALVLSKTYDYSAYECLNEKGREILIELESLNIKEYPVAGVALCRCILEYTLKLWLNEYGGEFNSICRYVAATGSIINFKRIAYPVYLHYFPRFALDSESCLL